MRKRFTYANVAATLALVFAMTGGALAANHYLITSTKQISPRVLKKLRGRTGKTGPMGPVGLAVTGPTGKTGAPGKEGLPGKTGATGLTGLTGKEGKEGQPGERGPSAGFDVKIPPVSFPATANEWVTVASRSLPAGSFTVLGKLIANNNAASANAEAECRLELGPSLLDEALLHMTANLKGADRATVVTTGAGTLSAPGTVALRCKVDSTEGEYDNAAITAIQVGALL